MRFFTAEVDLSQAQNKKDTMRGYIVTSTEAWNWIFLHIDLFDINVVWGEPILLRVNIQMYSHEKTWNKF